MYISADITCTHLAFRFSIRCGLCSKNLFSCTSVDNTNICLWIWTAHLLINENKRELLGHWAGKWSSVLLVLIARYLQRTWLTPIWLWLPLWKSKSTVLGLQVGGCHKSYKRIRPRREDTYPPLSGIVRGPVRIDFMHWSYLLPIWFERVVLRRIRHLEWNAKQRVRRVVSVCYFKKSSSI